MSNIRREIALKILQCEIKSKSLRGLFLQNLTYEKGQKILKIQDTEFKKGLFMMELAKALDRSK